MIVKSNELKNNVSDIRYNILISGFPGIGKTTLALSAPKPLLLDLDKGILRVNPKFHKDSSQVSSYAELLKDLNESNLSDYETIVIDTGERLFDLMKAWAIKQDAKNGQNDGTLTLKGYGKVGNEFISFINSIKYKLQKHCVVIFHAKEEKDNDIVKLRILIEGQSKDNVWQPMDLGGFIEMFNGDRYINFENCERHFAKGSFGVKGKYKIDNNETTGKNLFITELINKMNEFMEINFAKTEEEKKEYDAIMAKIGKQVLEMNADNINEIQDLIKNSKHILTTEIELKNMFKERLKEIGFKWDKDSKKYVSEKRESITEQTSLI